MSIVRTSDHTASNPRVDGIKLLNSVKQNLDRDIANTVNARIVTQSSFEHYLKTQDFTATDLAKIKEAAEELLAVSDTGLLAVRRAFFVPSLENPPGPRFLGIKNAEDTINAIKKVFDFAIEHGYYKEDGSIIEAFFYPFIDPPQLEYPLRDDAVFPKGGYAIPNDQDAKAVRVLAVFGNNEGVQSLSGVDEYVVDTLNQVITQKMVPQKEFALCTTTRAQDDKIKLPLKQQFTQVLSDFEILEAAMVVAECTKLKNKPQRVEFSSSGKSLFFNEVVDHHLKEVDWGDLTIEGKVLVIYGPEQIGQIERGNPNQILYISRHVVEKRDYDSLNTLAGIDETLNVLYPGTSATAHAMRVLVDAGHKAFVVGNREFRDNDSVRIVVKRSRVEIEIVEKKEKEKHIIAPLDEANLYDVELVGGKASKLGQLIALGYKVPEGYVIKSTAPHREGFLEGEEFTEFVASLDPAQEYAVRSSANVEDGSKNAFAGQFNTEIRITKNHLAKAVEKVWASAKTSHIERLVKDLGLPKVEIAVAIQEMIKPSVSGVTFGANIETRDPNQVMIELTNGYAEGVVDGHAAVRKVLFDKATKQILDDIQPEPKVKIKEDELLAIFEMYLRLEENFGTMQDVEWTIDTEGNLFVLQTRNLMV